MNEYNFKICGNESQFIDISLAPSQRIMAEPGAMALMDSACEMETVLGNGEEKEGFFGKIMGAGHRVLTGEKLTLVQITSPPTKSTRVVLSAPYQGAILPLDLQEYNGEFICQKGAYLGGAPGVKISIALQKKISSGFFGGEGFLLQRLSSDGLIFIHAGGSLIKHTLDEGESIVVDTGSVVGFENTVKFNIKFVKGIKNIIFGQEGITLVELTGPGCVYAQSMPFNRLAGQILSQLPPSILESK